MATDAGGSRVGARGTPPRGERWRRLAWFFGIWAASAAAVIVFGWIVRKLIGL